MSHTNENTVNLLSNAANNVDAISSYNELRKGLVKHLKQKGLDWKVGQTNRRTELLHKTLLVLEDVKSPQLINLDLIYNIAECLYSKRQNTEAANIEVNEDVQQLVDNYSDFIVERYEVKQLFKTIDQKSVNTLKNVFILQQEVNKDTVKEALGKLLAAKGIHHKSVEKIEFTSNPVTLNGIEESDYFVKGITGLRKQYLKQQLERLEEIRTDQSKIDQIKPGNDAINQETYWYYRKQNAAYAGVEIDQVLNVFPKVWSIFLRNKNDNNVTLPLQYPIKEYLKSITCSLLKRSEAETKVASQIDLTPVIPDEALQKWDDTIRAEEQILDDIQRNDQRYFGELVKNYQSEFTAGLVKVFKLYDNSLKERPTEIYYRSLSEVIHKVETGKLVKPLTSSFKTFLIGVGVNQYRQEYFKKTEKPLDIDEGFVENIIEPDTIERKHQQEANAAKVKSYLSTIGEPCRELIEMKFLKGYNYEVMSIKTGKKEGALRTQVSRCMDRLRKMI